MIDPLYNFSIWEPEPPISCEVSERAVTTARQSLHSIPSGTLERFDQDIFWQLFLIDNTDHFDNLPKRFFDCIHVIPHPKMEKHIAFRIVVPRNRLFNHKRSHNLPKIDLCGEGWTPLLEAAMCGTKIGYAMRSDSWNIIEPHHYLERFEEDELNRKRRNEFWNTQEEKAYPIEDHEPSLRGTKFELPSLKEAFHLPKSNSDSKVKCYNKCNSNYQKMNFDVT